MRISDWSSDVCSSDLPFPRVLLEEALLGYPARTADERKRAAGDIGRDVRPHLGVIVRETRLGDSRVGPVEPVRMGEHGLGALLPAGACGRDFRLDHDVRRSEEHTSELQSLMRISYAVFCLKKKKTVIEE